MNPENLTTISDLNSKGHFTINMDEKFSTTFSLCKPHVAVEPSKSPVLSGGNPGAHKIQGIGAGFVPGNYDSSIIDEVVQVTDEDAFKTAKDFAAQEGVLIGISSGAAVFAAIELAKKVGKGKKILAIAPDGGEKYISMGLYD